ncbi:MAG: hypothetical protein ACFCBW_13925 [Candidatus Competibacterales bacterium]
MATSNQQRSELVAALWELKQNLAKSDQPLRYVHFNMLLSDEDYRNEVISKAEASDMPAIRALAERARTLNMGGKLLATSTVGSYSGAGHPPHADYYSGSGPQPVGVNTEPAGWDDEEDVAVPHRSRLWLWLPLTALLAVAVAATAYLTLTGQLPLLDRSVRVSGSIFESTVWSGNRTYILEDVVFVEAGARLTIEPGAMVQGLPGSALVVTRDASLYARGEPSAPIVFTSAQPVGQRRRGDWGGVVLLGNAPVNVANARIEGLPETDTRGYFGGPDQFSNCGLMEYARVEFAGFEAFANNELNGLTLGGCGRNTVIRYVQVHKALDDGVEMFGGNANLRHIVITGAADDSLDWDMGWRGNVQFLVVQQHADDGDSGFEADSNEADHDARPRSLPVIYNFTLVGSRSIQQAQRAMVLRRGTGGHFRNFIITGFPLESVDIRDVAALSLLDSNELTFAGGILYDIGPNGNEYFSSETGDGDDDGGFDEASYFQVSERRLFLGLNPQMPTAAFDPVNPDFTPAVTSPAVQGAVDVPQGEFWDEAAGYLGAIRPGVSRNWLDGWTAFPAD